jgi:uncharacterized protein YndB with AHSA1/START domain
MTGFRSTASILINASPAKVWEAVTSNELRKKWFFGVDTATDWTVGGPIVHRGEYQGQSYVDKGTILAFEPEKLLVHSHWSSVSGVPDAPENYQTVSWVLSEQAGQTKLTVTDDNIRSEDAQATSDQAWEAALSALKEVAES